MRMRDKGFKGVLRGTQRRRVRRKAPAGSRRGSGKALGVELRTDLALEEKERFPGDGGEINGVSWREWQPKGQQIKISEVRILNERGARAMGKEMGVYLTVEAQGMEKKSEEFQEKLAGELAEQIRKLIRGDGEKGSGRQLQTREGKEGLQGKESEKEKEGRQESQKEEGSGVMGRKRMPERVLVVGLGNLYVTPDSLGPRVLQHLQVTRHYDGQYGKGFLKEQGMASISAIAPGVMAQTGMETAEILKGVVEETRPELVVAIDALAARSVHRLGCTIQLSDTGIHPGSGVGNHRSGLTRKTLGVPVLAVGVPTVVGAAAIVQDTIGAMVKALELGKDTKGAGGYLGSLGPDEQYALIRELLEPEFGPMFVTPPDIEERVEQLGRVIGSALEQAFHYGGGAGADLNA